VDGCAKFNGEKQVPRCARDDNWFAESRKRTSSDGLQDDTQRRTARNRCATWRALPCFVGELAAAFGALGQFGVVPAATEGLDQADCVDQAAAENIHRGDFVR